MKIILSAAVSADGYIDDATPQRLILSSPEDLAAIRILRASCDAVLVGANTIRRDNPVLAGVPVKVTVTASGNLPREARFFQEDGGKKLVYCPAEAVDDLQDGLGGLATIIAVPSLNAMVRDLRGRRVKKLLVEGGTAVLTQFLSEGLADELRLTIAPFFVGDAKAPRLVSPAPFHHDKNRRMKLVKTETLGDMAILHYALEKA